MFQRVLVTGANGLVGQAVLKRFSRQASFDVLATGRDPEPRFEGGSGGYVKMDVTDEAQVQQTFEDFAPTTVLHLAAVTRVEECEVDRDRCWRTNVDAVETLAATCRSHGARIILASTDFVFSGADGPYAEDARPGPVNFYGRSKLAAENAVRVSGLTRWSIVRTALVFGPTAAGARGNFVTFLARELGGGRAVRVPSDQVRTPTYVEDLAEGLARLVEYPKNGVYHLSGREMISVESMARKVADTFGFSQSLISTTATEDLHPGAPRPLETALLILKAESEIGFRPTPLLKALERVRDADLPDGTN